MCAVFTKIHVAFLYAYHSCMHKNMTLVNDIATQAYKTKFLFKYFASITVRYSIMQLLSGTQVAGSFRATWTLVYLMDCFNILDLQFVHITPLVIRFNNAVSHLQVCEGCAAPKTGGQQAATYSSCYKLSGNVHRMRSEIFYNDRRCLGKVKFTMCRKSLKPHVLGLKWTIVSKF